MQLNWIDNVDKYEPNRQRKKLKTRNARKSGKWQEISQPTARYLRAIESLWKLTRVQKVTRRYSEQNGGEALVGLVKLDSYSVYKRSKCDIIMANRKASQLACPDHSNWCTHTNIVEKKKNAVRRTANLLEKQMKNHGRYVQRINFAGNGNELTFNCMFTMVNKFWSVGNIE